MNDDLETRKARASDLNAEVDEHNWDVGIARVAAIVDDPDCDDATARMIFWRAEPSFYYGKALAGKAFQPYEAPTYELLRRIEEKMKAGGFPHLGQSYDPFQDWQIDRDDPGTRQIAAVMFEAVRGEG